MLDTVPYRTVLYAIQRRCNVECKGCGNDAEARFEFLGLLGALAWVRCKLCGWTQSASESEVLYGETSRDG